MIRYIKKNIEQLFTAMLFIAILNIGIASIIDRLKHPELTETQLFLRIPQEFVWNFKP